MPTSAPLIIPDMIAAVQALKPKTILDVGCGFGKYGFLLREYLDIAEGRYFKDEWIIQIDCVEPYEDYITDVHRYVYNRIRIEDIRKIPIDELKHYDLILMADVIEHLEKDEAIKLVKEISSVTNVLVSTPNGFFQQRQYKENTQEIHQCGFTKKELEKEFNAKVIETEFMLIGRIKCQKDKKKKNQE